MTAKTENANVLPLLPLRPVSQNNFYRLMVPFRVDGHISYSGTCNLDIIDHSCVLLPLGVQFKPCLWCITRYGSTLYIGIAQGVSLFYHA